MLSPLLPATLPGVTNGVCSKTINTDAWLIQIRPFLLPARCQLGFPAPPRRLGAAKALAPLDRHCYKIHK